MKVGVRAGVGTGLLAFGWFTLVSLAQWYGGNVSTFDLGLFAQVAQSWSVGGPPYSAVRGLNVLGEHFSPILVLFGLAWLVWPDPRVLLVTQALALAVAAGLLVGTAAGRLGRRGLALVVVTTLTGYGVLAALTFDVHEVAFAPVLVVLLGLGVVRGRLPHATAGAVGLLLVKEDLGFTVLAAAVLWWFVHPLRRRPAVLLAGLGVVGLAVAYGTIAWLGPDFGAVYADRLTTGAGWSWASVPARLVPAGAFVLATLGIGLRSPVVVLAVPTLAWRAISGTRSYWTLHYHYDLISWAVAGLAVATTLPGRQQPDRLRGPGRFGIAAAAVLSVGLGLSRFAGAAPPWAPLTPDPVVADVAAVAAQLPPGAVVAAQDQLGSYLIPRAEVVALDVRSSQPAAYALFRTDGAGAGRERAPACARDALARTADAADWATWSAGPVRLVRLPAPAVVPLPRC